MTSAQIGPLRIDVPQRDLDDLRARLTQTRWATPADREYGFALPRLRRLVHYWLAGYDWRAWEARLNSYPQFATEIDGQPVHFLHVRPPARVTSKSICRLAERDHARIASWHVLPAVSGHYAAHTHPDAAAADISAFFTSLPQRTRPRPLTPLIVPLQDQPRRHPLMRISSGR